MSSYRTYVPWNKSSSSSTNSYSSNNKKETPSTASNSTSKYESTTFIKSRPDAKKNEEKTTNNTTTFNNNNKYTNAYTLGYQRNTQSSTERVKSPIDKKDHHPPVSYRPLVRTSNIRSREPSPEVTTKTDSNSSYSFGSRLYPTRTQYNRERHDSAPSISSTPSTIPKYTGRSSLNKDDSLLGRTSRNSSREDLSLAKYKPPETKQELLNSRFLKNKPKEENDRYSTTSKEDLSRLSRFSRDDLSKPAQKYITSRFLPKNSIEKSHTAYIRPSTIRTSEVSRKNRELLNTLRTHHDSTSSSSRSYSKSISTNENPKPLEMKRPDSLALSISSSLPTPSRPEKIEMECINVVTRSTSPNLQNTSSNLQRPKKVEVARLIEKQISRSKKRPEMRDAEVQSDRLDDSTKTTRIGRISAPWNSYLDLKYSSPENSEAQKSQKALSRNNSAKSLVQVSSKPDLRLKSRSNSSQSLDKPKSKKPPIPKSEIIKPSQIPAPPNKDFRKSVLNMADKTKRTSRSASSSSGDSEPTSENKIQQERERRLSSSSSVSSTSSSGSTEDDLYGRKIKKEESKPPQSPRKEPEASKSFLMRALAPVTNFFKVKQQETFEDSSEATDKNISELPKSFEDRPRKLIKNIESGERSWWFEENYDGSKTKGKLRLLRHADSGERAWWLDEKADVPEGVDVYPAISTAEDGKVEGGKLCFPDNDSSEATDQNISDIPKSSSDDKKPKILICRVGSGEREWWLEESSSSASSKEGKIRLIKHINSGELAWWLDEKAEIPEGVEVHLATAINEDGKSEDGKLVYKLRRTDSAPTEWWMSDNTSSSQSKSQYQSVEQKEPEFFQKYNIRHIDSGERAWWISSNEHINELDQLDGDGTKSSIKFDFPLGDRASPEGLETPRCNEEEDEGRHSPYDNVPIIQKKNKKPSLFISKHTNIDDILGGSSQLLSPLMERIFSYQEYEECKELEPEHIKIRDGLEKKLGTISCCMSKLDDAALQLYKDGDYGSYLDLDASISEQQEEFDGFHSNKKNSIVLRTQLSVRVHTIIEKLLTSEGRELRRALFSLKQIFQEDKDLVHEFVQNDGLACLIKVGSEADQNYQNYILRALGQVMLYVDGMNGVMEHNETIQWLYALISSKFRLVVKTALKLLLVFVEYTDSNCLLLIKAIHSIDTTQGLLPWHNIMKLLKDFDSADTELLIYATTLINKCLNGVPDQDTYYDQTDALEEQGIEKIIKRYMSKPGTDLDLLQQFQIYEAVLQYEDGEDKGTPIRHLDESIRKTLRNRKSLLVASTERRKSRRHSTGTTPLNLRQQLMQQNVVGNGGEGGDETNGDDDEDSSSQSSNGLTKLNRNYKDPNKSTDVGVTPALRRRRERAERQRSFMKEQQENGILLRGIINTNNDENENGGNFTNGLQQRLTNTNNVLNRNSCRKDLTPYMNAVNKLELDEQNGLTKQSSWIMYKENDQQSPPINQQVDNNNTNDDERRMLLQLKKENTVKDLTQKLSSQNILHSPTSDENKLNRIEGMTGLINKAKEGLAKSKSQAIIKSPTGENIPKVLEVKKSENELRWEELVQTLTRPLNLCDMDFTDLEADDENDVLAPVMITNGIPPPPPPLEMNNAPPPPPRGGIPPSPPVFGITKLQRPSETKIPVKKNKKTVKLFWKEVRDDPMMLGKVKNGFIWDELNPVAVDTQKLEHLFESRAKDSITKKQQEMNKNKEIIVLDTKRSNAINIGMTKLPPPRSIKTAILKMDATIMNREGIEKLLTMLPTEEERSKIQEAQATNPDLPLGSAEQFLLTLASISELPARLKLWAFKLDFENTEREIAEPLMDLKQGVEVLRVNKTFRGILSTLLSIGNFLNGNEVKGFQIEYLSKVPEVKDTVHKHSLLHHLCHIVMEKFPDATDLYSEIGAITRASKVDFDELALNIQRLESDCKASWDHLKLIAKYDGSTMKSKMSDFLADCAERIILLGIIHRRVMNRFHKFLLWLGIPLHQIAETKPNEFCRIVSEFALEYRTTRERVLQQLEKKANHRERNKTRGKMITETAKFRTKEDRADAELRQLLGSDYSDVESLQGTLRWRRTKKDATQSLMNTLNGHLTDGDDEILESLVKTATKGQASRTAPRERKRTRHADRKSLKRSRTRENPFGHRDSP